MPRPRRLAAPVLVLLLVVGAAALSPVPVSAEEVPRLLGASVATTPTGGTGPGLDVVLTLDVSGDVSGAEVSWTHDLGGGAVQTFRSNGGMQVNPGDTRPALSFATPAALVAGTWTLATVTLSSRAEVERAYGVPGRPIPGTVPTFVATSGPTSLAEAADTAGRVTAASMLAPSGPSPTVALGGTVSTQVTFTGRDATASGFAVLYRHEATGVVVNGGGYQPAGSSGTFTSSTTVTNSGAWIWPEGTWTLYGVRVYSTAGTERWYVADGANGTLTSSVLVNNSSSPQSCFTYYGLAAVPEGCLAVDTLPASVPGLGSTFTVTGTGVTDRDLTPPGVSGVTVSPAAVAPGGTVTVSATYTDAASAPSPGGGLYVLLGNGTTQRGTGTSTTTCTGPAPYSCTVSASVTLPPAGPFGSYTVRQVLVRDAPGNWRLYTPTTMTTRTWGPETTVPKPAGEPVLTGPSRTVTATPPGGTPDTAPPVLTSFTRTSAPSLDGTGPATATWSWTGGDGAGSGVASIEIVAVNPTSAFPVSFGFSPQGQATTLTPGVLSADLGGYGAGPWVVRSVRVVDRAGNERRYDADGTVSPAGGAALDLMSAGVLVDPVAAVPGVPGPPRSLRVGSRDGALAVSWSAPAPRSGVSAPTTYDVRVEPGGLTSSVSGTSTVVTGLTNGRAYTVAVAARNAAGAGPVSWVPGTAVEPVAPVVGPTVVRWPAVSRTATLVLRATPPKPQVGAPVVGYRTQVRIAPPRQALPAVWSTFAGIRPVPSTTIAGLPRGTRVCARVVPVNDVGLGAPSAATCTAILADDRSLSRSAGWVSAVSRTAYVRTLTVSTRTGATLSTGPARGTAVAVAAQVGPGAGSLGVYVGGKRVAVIRLAAKRAAFVVRSVRLSPSGRPIVLRVESPGRTGVRVDGVAVLP